MYCTVEKDYFNTASLGVQDYSFAERIQYDTISEIQSKGWTEMSYAGMVLCPKGIVAFADSKASRITMIGNMFEDTSALESEIDLLVYHLYGLTYDDVLIVDPETPITKEEYNNNKK